MAGVTRVYVGKHRTQYEEVRRGHGTRTVKAPGIKMPQLANASALYN